MRMLRAAELDAERLPHRVQLRQHFLRTAAHLLEQPGIVADGTLQVGMLVTGGAGELE